VGRAVKRLSLTFWIFFGMAAGVALGVFAPGFAKQLAPVSNVFLRLIIERNGPPELSRQLALERLRAGIEQMRFSLSGPLPPRDELHDRV